MKLKIKKKMEKKMESNGKNNFKMKKTDHVSVTTKKILYKDLLLSSKCESDRGWTVELVA